MVEQDKCRENQKNGSRFGSRGMSDRRLSPLIEYPEYQNAEYEIGEPEERIDVKIGVVVVQRNQGSRSRIQYREYACTNSNLFPGAV